MAKISHLAKAPITEAIIDLRTKLPEGFESRRFETLKDTLRETYPKVQDRWQISGKLKVMDHVPVLAETPEKEHHGLFFKTEDELNLAQFRVDGFTFNRLRPYTSWEQIFPEALRLWQLYVDVAEPEAVTRIAARYINRLSLPVSGAASREFSYYMTAPPPVPDGLPEAVSQFLTKVVVHQHDTGISANIIMRRQ